MLLSQAVDLGRRRLRQKRAQWEVDLVEPSPSDCKCEVYLITFARVLQERLQLGGLRDVTRLRKAKVLECVVDSWNNPVQGSSGGRPRESASPLVRKAVVFEEAHEDGSKHFHVAVLLSTQMRFSTCKRTLQERHGLAAHFSTTHTQWWSALRYGMESPKKPNPDKSPLRWVPPGASPIDLFEESQEPFTAKAWRVRREERDCEAAKEGANSGFTKLDFNALVISKELGTKAAVLRYVKNKGTVAMQLFVTNNQRRLDQYLEEAFEFDNADETAAAEEETDWALVGKCAEKVCDKGDACEYCVAAKNFFERNAANFSQADLAEALRRIIVSGPGKDARVPFLVGDTNTGKSSLVESFDQLFGDRRVYHLPAVTDVKFALRNWLRNKRFVLWDEFSPVEFATMGVLPVTQFKKAFNGQWFEIQVAQCHHDGNPDFRWQHGAIFTNKIKGLWEPTKVVSQEDIQHLQSRVRLFHCTSVFKQKNESKPSVPQCAHHLAKWICEGAASFDARQALRGELPSTAPSDGVMGLEEILATARLPEAAEAQLKAEVLASGALHVNELTADDWAALPSWPALRSLEQRRLWRAVGQHA